MKRKSNSMVDDLFMHSDSSDQIRSYEVSFVKKTRGDNPHNDGRLVLKFIIKNDEHPPNSKENDEYENRRKAFRKRIKRLSKILSPILRKDYRDMVYESITNNLYARA